MINGATPEVIGECFGTERSERVYLIVGNGLKTGNKCLERVRIAN